MMIGELSSEQLTLSTALVSVRIFKWKGFSKSRI